MKSYKLNGGCANGGGWCGEGWWVRPEEILPEDLPFDIPVTPPYYFE